MQALIHLLRYLHDNAHLGVRFYSDVPTSPIYKLLLLSKNFDQKQVMFKFSDSSWNDDNDDGCSTGSSLIYYMEGIVDHSSNTPDTIALSSAKAEYNEARLACMATNHLRMLN